MPADPGEILVGRAGVDNEPVPRAVAVVDDQIVDDAGGFVQHAAVERLARSRQPRDVVGKQPAQELARPRTFQVDDPHVRDIEHAGVAAYCVVFLDLRAVVQRHVPAAEINEPRAELAVPVVQRCVQGHAVSTSTPPDGPVPPKRRGDRPSPVAPLSVDLRDQAQPRAAPHPFGGSVGDYAADRSPELARPCRCSA